MKDLHEWLYLTLFYEWSWQASTLLTACSCWGSLSSDRHLVGANCTLKFALYGHISGMSYIQRYCYTLAQCVSIEHFWSNTWYFSHATLTAIVNSRNGNWKWKTEFEKLKLKSEISSNAYKLWASYIILHISLTLTCSYVYRTAS